MPNRFSLFVILFGRKFCYISNTKYKILLQLAEVVEVEAEAALEAVVLEAVALGEVVVEVEEAKEAVKEVEEEVELSYWHSCLVKCWLP